MKTDKLMLYREIVVVCSQIQAKHINAIRAEHRIYECYSWWYIKYVLGYKRIIKWTFNTECPTRSPNPAFFFNNSNNNEDIATNFEQQYVLFFHISHTIR
jgi:hypothetical protein